MSKLRTDLRVALAGVCCGLMGVSVFLLAARIDAYHAHLRWLRETDYQGTYNRGVEDLWWVPFAVLHIALSVLASLLMHRYLSNHRVSSFLRWQAIGVVALIGWGLTMLTGIGMSWLDSGNFSSLDQMFGSAQLIDASKFVATISAANVLFGSAVQAAVADTRDHNQIEGDERLSFR